MALNGAQYIASMAAGEAASQAAAQAAADAAATTAADAATTTAAEAAATAAAEAGPGVLAQLGNLLSDNVVANNVVYPAKDFCAEWGPWAFWHGVGIGKAVAWDYTLQPAGEFIASHPVGTGIVAGTAGVLFMAHKKGYDLNPLHIPEHVRTWREARAKHHTANPLHKDPIASTSSPSSSSSKDGDDTIAHRVKTSHESGSDDELRGREVEQVGDTNRKERSRSRSPNK